HTHAHTHTRAHTRRHSIHTQTLSTHTHTHTHFTHEHFTNTCCRDHRALACYVSCAARNEFSGLPEPWNAYGRTTEKHKVLIARERTLTCARAQILSLKALQQPT